jgi:hypothetical protein
MFGLEFLFGWALLALPLAGAPVLLHLLFRRKSPVVQFSTLRFIRSSIQRTAARKRIQQWLLLACRVLLMALLIWAIAQPAKLLASRWLRHGSAPVAAIVADNSYSMLLQQNHVTRLDEENDAIGDLLRNELRDAQVAIFTANPPPANEPETLQSASALLAGWSPLKPEPNPQPLANRVAAAAAFLDRQDASDKWLIVLSDLQNKEFPRPLPAFDGGRFVMLDLHADDPRSVGITKVSLDPPQPVPGVLSQAVVDVVGQAGDQRAVTVSLIGPDGQEIYKSPPTMASLDSGGSVQLRFPIKLPNQRFIGIKAALSGDDDLPWDDTRTHLVEVPPRQPTRLLTASAPAAGDQSPALRAVHLALDPNQGALDSWPLNVRTGVLSGDDRAAVAVLTQWPSEAQTVQLVSLARTGGSVVLFLSPGLQQASPALPDSQKAALLDLLPSAPVAGAFGGNVIVTAAHDPLLNGLTDDQGIFPPGHVRRLLPFAGESSTSAQSARTVLGIESQTATGQPQGLLFRKPLGKGLVYTIATLPDPLDSNLATNPDFLPLLVRMCLPSAAGSNGSNIELGQPVIFDAPSNAGASLALETPSGGSYVIPGVDIDGGRRFTFSKATEPGFYIWRGQKSADALAVVNVQLPASESELVFRPADTVMPHSDNVVIARSMVDLRSKMKQLTEPEPRWSGAVALVLILICLEALMGSTSGLWKPVLPNLFRPKMPTGAAS